MSGLPWSRHLPVIALLAIAVVIGILVVPHYGESWDEYDIRRYSDYAIGAYASFLHPGDLQPFETNLNLYGPAYVVIAGVLARLLVSIVPSWSTITAWHTVYFLTFIAGAAGLYALARRWMTNAAAFGVTLLFVTQPLLWGHGFINPKDVAFLTFFLLTIVLGLAMADRIGASRQLIPFLVLAAILLGMTSSLRVLGPLAGVIVLVYAASKVGSRAILPAAMYLGLGMLVMYVSWPYLWAAPISHLLQSLSTMADFPFNSTVLFGSGLYKANELPWTYFPVLLGIQLTEPVLVLMAAGIVAAVLALAREGRRGPFLLFLGWFLVPTAIILAARSPLYDNARQLYFLLPPLFVVAGLALEWLFRRIQGTLPRALLLAIAALPGILVGARLHPYEYVYYNALVGGTGGAFRHYEMDYWGTSFDEISRYMNAALPSDSKVLVYGPEQIIADRARPDLQIFIPREDVNPGYDYVVLLTRSNADQRLCKDTEAIFSVERRGAVFSELRSIPDGSKCQ